MNFFGNVYNNLLNFIGDEKEIEKYRTNRIDIDKEISIDNTDDKKEEIGEKINHIKNLSSINNSDKCN